MPVRTLALTTAAATAAAAITLAGCAQDTPDPEAEATPAASAAEATAGATGDALLTSLLAAHVDPSGLVDYDGLSEDAATLDAYLEHLAGLDLLALDRPDQLAAMLNAYNAFTLKLMLENPGVASIRDIAEESRWTAERWMLAGKTVSLDALEHEWIRGGFNEPNIHFALVCAAESCPPLRQEAYSGEELSEQLDDQARAVHAGDKWFGFDAEANVVRLTELYKWYAEDFVDTPEGGETGGETGGEADPNAAVLEYAARYSPELRAALDAGRTPRVEWIAYDWTVNDAESGAAGSGAPSGVGGFFGTP